MSRQLAVLQFPEHKVWSTC